MSSNNSKLIKAKEAGLVSIMVTLIMMIVISLIVIGFAQISRRNQRQALDRQLSAQAFYAAETGINDTRELIRAALAGGGNIDSKTDCGPSASYSGLTPDLDSQTNVAYTCILVDPSPETLLYGDIGPTGAVIPLASESGTNIDRVVLTWQSKDDTATPSAGCPSAIGNVFPPVSSWSCGYGVLRFDLVPTDGVLSYSSLQSNTMSSFAVPYPGGGINSISFGAGGLPNRLWINCDDTNCNLTIEPQLINSNQFYLRVQSWYKNSSLRVSALDEFGQPVALVGAQAVVDSTGKAQDVLRRVQAHVPLTNSSQNQLADYGLQTTESICKRFVVMDNYFDTDVTGVTSSNPLCQP